MPNYSQQFQPMFCMLNGLQGTDSTFMTNDSLQQRILRYALLDPIEDTLAVLRRAQNNEAFRQYLLERRLQALLLVVGIVLASLAFAGATAVSIIGVGTLLAVLAALVTAPILLIASLWVQARVLLSWLEGRALAKLQEHRRPRHRGPIGRWFVRSFRIDMGPFPRVPPIPALLFFLLPAVLLARVAAPVAAGLFAFQTVAAIVYARRDPVSGVERSLARRGVEAPRSFAAAPQAAAPLRRPPLSRDTNDLDFAPSAPRASTGSLTRSLRSFARSAFRYLGSLFALCLDNFLPFVEYCALIAGIYAVAAGRRSASEQDVALGMLVIGAAFLLAGLAAIVTQRMSFRFYGSAHRGYTRAARIAGVMQLIVSGLALAAAHALATHAWQARLDALLVNPWPLLIPLGLLLIGAGLLLLRPSGSYVGPLGTVLFIVPKTLTGVAALGAGAVILAGWAWSIYDPQAFRSFIRVLPDEYMSLLEKGWSAAIALLR